MMNIDLSDRVVLVTGGARGIGAATVRAVVAAGASAVINDLSANGGCDELRRELGDGRVYVVPADLARPESIPALWADALAWKGHVDVLVNNAGIYEKASVADDFETWAASWDRTLAVNLVSAAHLCREAIRHFLTRGGGTIINIASRAAFRGDAADYPHYAASKAGLVALTRTIARGFGKDKILAFAVAPGFVNTLLNAEWFREHGEEAAVREIPLGEMAMPDDIANFVAFLASGFARHATGATFDINGASYVR